MSNAIQGMLVMKQDRTIYFSGGTVENGWRVTGNFNPPLPIDFAVSATLTFSEKEGPYILTGEVGNKGVKLTLNGPVGQGTITSDFVDCDPVEVSGSCEIQRQ